MPHDPRDAKHRCSSKAAAAKSNHIEAKQQQLNRTISNPIRHTTLEMPSTPPPGQVDARDAAQWTPLFYAAGPRAGQARTRASRRGDAGAADGVRALLDGGADVTYFSVVELYYRAPRFLAVSGKNPRREGGVNGKD